MYKATGLIQTLLFAATNAILASCLHGTSDLAFWKRFKRRSQALHVAEPNATEASQVTARKELIKISCKRYRRMPDSPTPELGCQIVFCFHRAVTQKPGAFRRDSPLCSDIQGTTQNI